ncbi:MAG: tetratricopeptide repeat protein [Planctomycetia bacterium]|nr:tetratricopeptide repeat protein [Planctomycetia bacterium]
MGPGAGLRHTGPAAGLRQGGGAPVGARQLGGGARLGGGTVGPIAHPGVVAGGGSRLGGVNRAGITSRPYAGNSLNYGNRSFNLAQSNYRPAFYGHGLYHGYWNGNYGFGGGYGGGWGGYGPGWGYGGGWGYGPGYGLGLGLGLGLGYGFAPLGWGYGGWGLGSMAYNSGYLGYSNPYYNGSFGGYDYAQPIPVDYSVAPTAVGAEGNTADAALNAAVEAFKQNDYDAALDIVNKGVAQFPNDSVLHEFRALVLFARRDYQQAAATIHSVLAIGPGWDWTTLASLYTSIAIYTEQLRALEEFTRANPQDGGGHFLLGYHYMSAGHAAAAAKQFQQVVTLVPGDRVAADLTKMLSAPSADQQPTPQPPVETQTATPEATPVDPATLVGTWQAAREDGSKFELTLTPDSKFTWKFSMKGQKPQEFSGTYTVETNVLALERQEGGSLIGQVTPGAAGKFNFRLVGAPPEDKGLNFGR